MPVTESGCWIWLLSGNRLGYGMINVDGKMRSAHRVSWEAYNQRPAPRGFDVLHTCDLPCCVNPDHLRLGSEGENMREMVAKGRYRSHWAPTDSLWDKAASITQSKFINYVGLSDKERIETLSMPVSECGCWMFLGQLSHIGYGRIKNYKTGKQEAAHRVAYRAWKGYIPPDLWVLHRCDMRACVNPDHLFLGNQTDNMRDCVRKGRKNNLKGERHGGAKLTEEQVREIRKSSAAASTFAGLFGVSEETIRSIRSRRIWRHI